MTNYGDVSIHAVVFIIDLHLQWDGLLLLHVQHSGCYTNYYIYFV